VYALFGMAKLEHALRSTSARRMTEPDMSRFLFAPDS